MSLRGCGGRSPQAAVASGRSGKRFGAQRSLMSRAAWTASVGGMLPRSMCGIRAVVLPWSSPDPSQDLSAWRRAVSLPSVSSAQVRAWQEGRGLSALISIEVFPGPLRNAVHFSSPQAAGDINLLAQVAHTPRQASLLSVPPSWVRSTSSRER